MTSFNLEAEILASITLEEARAYIRKSTTMPEKGSEGYELWLACYRLYAYGIGSSGPVYNVAEDLPMLTANVGFPGQSLSYQASTGDWEWRFTGEPTLVGCGTIAAAQIDNRN